VFPLQPTVLLIGLRASGKSTVGPLVAAELRLPFIDLDPLTAQELGESSAAKAFLTKGQAAFRMAEATALSRVLQSSAPAVIALGGGTPTAPGFAQLLADYPDATLIYLRATPTTLRARLANTDTASRPSLTGKGTLDEMAEVFAARDPLYRALAHLEIAVDGLSESDAAARALSELASRRQTS